MKGNEIIHLRLIGKSCPLKGGNVIIRSSGIQHLYPIFGKNFPNSHGKDEIVILFPAAFIYSSRIRSAVPGIYHNGIWHVKMTFLTLFLY